MTASISGRVSARNIIRCETSARRRAPTSRRSSTRRSSSSSGSSNSPLITRVSNSSSSTSIASNAKRYPVSTHSRRSARNSGPSSLPMSPDPRPARESRRARPTGLLVHCDDPAVRHQAADLHELRDVAASRWSERDDVQVRIELAEERPVIAVLEPLPGLVLEIERLDEMPRPTRARPNRDRSTGWSYAPRRPRRLGQSSTSSTWSRVKRSADIPPVIPGRDAEKTRQARYIASTTRPPGPRRRRRSRRRRYRARRTASPPSGPAATSCSSERASGLSASGARAVRPRGACTRRAATETGQSISGAYSSRHSRSLTARRKTRSRTVRGVSPSSCATRQTQATSRWRSSDPSIRAATSARSNAHTLRSASDLGRADGSHRRAARRRPRSSPSPAKYRALAGST